MGNQNSKTLHVIDKWLLNASVYLILVRRSGRSVRATARKQQEEVLYTHVPVYRYLRVYQEYEHVHKFIQTALDKHNR